MRFHSVVAGIASGLFASFSAKENCHTCRCVGVSVIPRDGTGPESRRREGTVACREGDVVVRVYKCRAEDHAAARLLGLDEWTHTQTLRRSSRDRAQVEDDIRWKTCSARRTYLLRPDEAGKAVREDGRWDVESTGAPRAVLAIVARQLERRDASAFEKYSRLPDDDEPGGDGVEYALHRWLYDIDL